MNQEDGIGQEQQQQQTLVIEQQSSSVLTEQGIVDTNQDNMGPSNLNKKKRGGRAYVPSFKTQFSQYKETTQNEFSNQSGQFQNSHRKIQSIKSQSYILSPQKKKAMTESDVKQNQSMSQILGQQSSIKQGVSQSINYYRQSTTDLSLEQINQNYYSSPQLDTKQGNLTKFKKIKQTHSDFPVNKQSKVQKDHLQIHQEDDEDDDNNQQRAKVQYEPMQCTSCNLLLPMRARHCRSCLQCVATFDHHCPWIGLRKGIGSFEQENKEEFAKKKQKRLIIPNPPHSAYIEFANNKRQQWKKFDSENYKNLKTQQVLTQCAAEWKTSPEEEKEVFMKKAKEAREQYIQKMKTILSHFKSAKSKIKRKKYPNKPKKPSNAYAIYFKQAYNQIKQKNQLKQEPQNITKHIAKNWKSLTPTEKIPYKEKEMLEKKNQAGSMNDYIKNQVRKGKRFKKQRGCDYPKKPKTGYVIFLQRNKTLASQILDKEMVQLKEKYKKMQKQLQERKKSEVKIQDNDDNLQKKQCVDLNQESQFLIFDQKENKRIFIWDINPMQRQRKIISKLGYMWKVLDHDKRKEYLALSKIDQERYQKQVQKWKRNNKIQEKWDGQTDRELSQDISGTIKFSDDEEEDGDDNDQQQKKLGSSTDKLPEGKVDAVEQPQ